MEKELFYTIQDIKGYRNKLKASNTDKIIELLKTKEQAEIIKSKNYNRKYNKEKLKYSLLNFITFGQFCSLNSNICSIKLNNLKQSRDNSLEDYILYKTEKEKYINQKQINDNKKEFYDKNYKQIDMFLELLKTLSNDEKEKIFSYKMTQKTQKDDYIQIFRTIQGELFQQYNQICDILESTDIPDTKSAVLRILEIISLIMAETSFLVYFMIEHAKVSTLLITEFLIIKNIIRVTIKCIKHNTLIKDYKSLIKEIQKLETIYDYFEELINKISDISDDQLENYIKIEKSDLSNEIKKTYKIDI